MYLVFNSIAALLLLLFDRSATALSFTGNLNPFAASKPAPRSQLTSIDPGAYAPNADTYSNVRPIPNGQASAVRLPVPANLPVSANLNVDDGGRAAKWPNVRFMRTFLRNANAQPAGAPTATGQSYGQFNNDGSQFNPKYILGYNPTSAEQSKKLAKLPAASVQRKPSLNAENTDQPMGLVDWNRILAQLKQKTDARNGLNETAIRAATKQADASGAPLNDKKEEEEKESNHGLMNYLAKFFVSPNENETIQAEKEKQLAKQKLIGDKEQPSIDPIDLFYFNDNLLVKKQIEVLICDKTMAIINVRKNRFKTNRTVLNCVLFDLEKRGKVGGRFVILNV